MKFNLKIVVSAHYFALHFFYEAFYTRHILIYNY
jgi:hypothetical protein